MPITLPSVLARLAVTGTAAVLATVPGSATAAHGQEPPAPPARLTWGVRPSSPTGPDGRGVFVYTLEPGATIEDFVGVSNFSAEPLELDVYASDAFTTAEGGFDLLPRDRPPRDVGAWVAFAAPKVTVPPRSRLEVPFRLAVPANATPGDHPGGIVASLSSATTAPDGGRVAVDRRVGARLHLRVPGDLRPAVTVTGVDARYDGTVNPVAAGSATVTYTIENTGNVRVSGTPQIGVTGPFGRAAVTATGEPIGELLPGGRLTRTTTVTGVWPLVRISADVSIDPSPVAAPAPDPPAAVAGTTTWALPWPQLVLLAAIALIAVVLRRRRRAHRAQLAAAREQGRQEALTAGDVKGANPDGSARKPLLLRTSASPRREPANRDLS